MADATERNTPMRTPVPAREAAPLAVWRAGFLAALTQTGNVSEACRAVDIERSTAYRAKGNDPSFAEDWAQALQVATDALELEARRLATGYYESYKFAKDGSPLLHPVTGEPYTERVVHPGLLQTLLKAHRPELFGDKLKLDTTPAPQAYDLDKLSLDEKRQLLALSRKAQNSPDGAPTE